MFLRDLDAASHGGLGVRHAAEAPEYRHTAASTGSPRAAPAMPPGTPSPRRRTCPAETAPARRNSGPRTASDRGASPSRIPAPPPSKRLLSDTARPRATCASASSGPSSSAFLLAMSACSQVEVARVEIRVEQRAAVGDSGVGAWRSPDRSRSALLNIWRAYSSAVPAELVEDLPSAQVVVVGLEVDGARTCLDRLLFVLAQHHPQRLHDRLRESRPGSRTHPPSRDRSAPTRGGSRPPR